MTAADWLIMALIAVAAGGLAWVAWLTLHPTGRRGTRRRPGPAPLPVVLPAVGSSITEEDKALGWTEEKWANPNYWPDILGRPSYCGPAEVGDLYVPEDWREQTMTELAPEALDVDQETELVEAWVRDGMHVNWTEDPGPGGLVSSLPPGPEPLCSHGWPGTDCAAAHPYMADVTEVERLADTGDIYAAHAAAEWTADLHARDEDVRAFLSSLLQEDAQYRLDLAEALA